MMLRIAFASALAGFAVSALGCGAAVNCSLHGDNLGGHIIFGDGIRLEPGAAITIETSTDGFATVQSQKVIQNIQSLVSVPFSMCVATSTNFTVRAYQDSNRNGAPDPGEISGRDDGTATGDAAFITRNIPDSGPTGDWNTLGIDITLDH